MDKRFEVEIRYRFYHEDDIRSKLVRLPIVPRIDDRIHFIPEEKDFGYVIVLVKEILFDTTSDLIECEAQIVSVDAGPREDENDG